MSNTPPPGEARTAPPIYRDRAHAGLLLGEKVRDLLWAGSSADSERSRDFAIPAQASAAGQRSGTASAHPAIRVLAIPRGGVAIAAGVAHRLGAPLDVIVVRKIGHPEAPELGLGAVAEGGDPVFDDELLAQVGLTRTDLGGVVTRERAELNRRVAVYHAGVPGAGVPDSGAPAERRCEVAVVVDDGLATGVTARAALRAIRARGVPRIVLAVPVAAQQAVEAMEEELGKGKAGTGEVVTLVTARRFRSVGEWYADFGQLTDADVLTLLSSGGATPRVSR
jgi:putative phosphoribosyl transferase